MRTMQVDNFVERQVVAKQPSLHFLAKLINLQNYGNADYQRWKASWESERAVGQVLNALDARYYNYAGLPLKSSTQLPGRRTSIMWSSDQPAFMRSRQKTGRGGSRSTRGWPNGGAANAAIPR